MPCIWIIGGAAGVFLVASVIKLLQVWFVNCPVRRVDSASYRSANSNIADPQHIRSQQISGEETRASNIIDARNSRNKNSPDINQSNNCSNYETHHQNVSNLQKRTRCDERVSEVTPEGTDQIHSAPSSRLESTLDRDRSYLNSSNGSLNTPAGISRSSPVNIHSDALNLEEIQDVGKDILEIKKDILELYKKLQTDSNIDVDISLLLKHFGSPNVSTESLPNPNYDSSLDAEAKKEQDATAHSNSQTSSLANEAEQIQKALGDMKADLLEVKTKLEKDQLSRSCSRQSEISRRGPSIEDNSHNDNCRSLEGQTGSQASTSSNSGERQNNLDPTQVRLNLIKPKNFFEDGSRPQNRLKTLPTHLEQSSQDNNGRQSVVSEEEEEETYRNKLREACKKIYEGSKRNPYGRVNQLKTKIVNGHLMTDV